MQDRPEGVQPPLTSSEVVSYVESSIHKLVVMFNQNMHSIMDGFALTDVHLQVLRRVQNDHAKASVVRDADGNVDYTWYHREYAVYAHIAAAIGGLPKAQESTPAPRTDDMVFGG